MIVEKEKLTDLFDGVLLGISGIRQKDFDLFVRDGKNHAAGKVGLSIKNHNKGEVDAALTASEARAVARLLTKFAERAERKAKEPCPTCGKEHL